MRRISLFLSAALLTAPVSLAAAMPLTGSNGNDILFFQGAAGALNTSVTSPSGVNVPISGTFNINGATYDGLAGTDILLMTTGNDFLSSADVQNIEVFSSGDGADVLDLGSLTDTVFISGGNGGDILFTGAGDDTVFGSDGDDLIDGGAGENEIHGQGGNDTIVAGAGLNFLFGGDDLDTVLFAPGFSLADIITAELLSAAVQFVRPSQILTFNPGDLFVQFANSGVTGSFYAASDIEAFEVSGARFSSSEFVAAANADDTSAVPLPPSLALFGIGFAGLAVLRRRGARGVRLGEHRGGLAFHT